ncbi:hypothetical protein A5717_25865 [Mycolicibacterium porcinum]|uniref:hypothetical protein n=1 Tax=Mycolicibacterium porcinum TaxID=39693 RepID=UPI00080B9DB0|nr:hypothetical protein [Mycolicibacterium porcinum]OCB09207.1 hypothetical protein A5717_25865 [Mycolicibacterium porcinum]
MPLLALFVLLLFVEHWRWVTLVAVTAFLLWAAVRRHRAGALARRRAEAAKRARVRGLAARADQQHAWALDGDRRGTYGEYLPARTEERSA